MTTPDLDSLLPRLDALRGALARAVVGQHSVVEQLLIGLLAGCGGDPVRPTPPSAPTVASKPRASPTSG
ncbi:hypothetical protein G6F68_017973 [Rhizopus microsporus]|nr:hypothetical protein G6F68_017973 [Rhizopus microsporus]